LPRVVRIREGKVIFWLKPDAVEAAKGLGRNSDDVVGGAAAPVVETLRSPETDVYIDATLSGRSRASGWEEEHIQAPDGS
jgi:hypothetical protein